MPMTKMQDIQKKSDVELTEVVQSAREIVRAERFKDVNVRKSSVIKTAKTEIARALTELTARRRKLETK